MPTVQVGPGGTRSGTLMKEKGEPTVSGPVGPIDYPDSYGGDLKPTFVRNGRQVVRHPSAPDDTSRWEWYCLECSFRPWLDAGDASTVKLTVVSAGGGRATLPMTSRGGGRWVLSRPLADGERAFVEAGGVEDAYGNVNGERSRTVTP